MEEFYLPKELLMGTSVASVLNEGGNKYTNWYKWCEEGKVRDGSHIMRGTDHWNRYQEDIELMKNFHLNSCNMSIEWSRIEPKRGKFSKEAIYHYKEEINMLLENGIKPIITLHHFSNPQWFDDLGSWKMNDADIIFMNFVKVIVKEFGDVISDWITFNDANIYLISSYLWAWFPPGDKNLKIMLASMKNIIRAHIRSYNEIHKIRTENNYPNKTNVGFAMHLRAYDPVSNNLKNKFATKIAKSFVEGTIVKGMATGKFSYPIGLGGYPLGKGKFYDFIGVNHWTRTLVEFNPSPKNLFFELKTSDGKKYTGAMDPYPEGIYRVCKEYYEKYNAPIYIMQNGFKEKVDEKRTSIIYENLKYVKKLIDDGIPIKGFYIWSLTDLFETMEGESGKLGLVEINYKTQERTIKKSGYFFADVCENSGVTNKMIEKYFV